MEEYYTRRRERIGGDQLTALMEVSNGGGGVRSTDHDHRVVLSSSVFSTKRRKVDATEVLESCTPDVQLEIQNRLVVDYHEEVSISLVESKTAGHVLSTLCSSNEYSSDEAVKHSPGTLDLKVESFKPHEMSKFSNVSSFSRETTPFSEVSVDSKKMECPTPKKKSATAASSRRKPTSSKIPSTTEMEEFFSAAEKYEQKRFADKYNYDIVKDVPLEGRYQWVKLKP